MSGMERREFVAPLGGAAAGWPLGVLAQQNRMRRIGVRMARRLGVGWLPSSMD